MTFDTASSRLYHFLLALPSHRAYATELHVVTPSGFGMNCIRDPLFLRAYAAEIDDITPFRGFEGIDFLFLSFISSCMSRDTTRYPLRRGSE